MNKEERILKSVGYVWCDELDKMIAIERYTNDTPRAIILHEGYCKYLQEMGSFKEDK